MTLEATAYMLHEYPSAKGKGVLATARTTRPIAEWESAHLQEIKARWVEDEPMAPPNAALIHRHPHMQSQGGEYVVRTVYSAASYPGGNPVHWRRDHLAAVEASFHSHPVTG